MTSPRGGQRSDRGMPMSRTAFSLLVVLLLSVPVISPALAQQDCPDAAPDCTALPRLLDDLTRDLSPWMEGLADRLSPHLRQLTDLLGDLTGWEAPEVLPNGDILIRRRPARPAVPDHSDTDPLSEPFEL